MPQDFSKTTLDAVKVYMDDLFNTNATVHSELTKNPITAPALMRKQTANINLLKDGSGNKCVGTRVDYLIADNTAVPTISTSPITGSCDLKVGDTVSSNAKDFDFNVFLKEYVKVNDKDCDNTATFVKKTSFALAHKMSMLVQGINEKWITELEANKSVVSATNLPDGVTVPGSGEYTLDGASYWNGIEAADTISILDQLARVKGLPNNYFIISGKALRVPKSQAQDRQINDNQRSFFTTFNRRDIFNDEDNLDSLIGSEVIYLVDPNVLVSYFYSEYEDEPTPVGDKKGTMRFSMDLMYYNAYQNGSLNLMPLQFMNGGSLETVKVDVRYQKGCNNTTTKYAKPSLDHVWELDLIGLLDLIPATGDNTGIIRVDKVI